MSSAEIGEPCFNNFTMKKLLTTTFLFFCFSVLAFAQSSQGGCTQKISEFPAVRGLKLNMTQSDVLKVYPLAVPNNSKDEIGVRTMSVLKSEIDNDELKRNLKSIGVELLDDKIKRIFIAYDKSVKWVALPKFVESLTENFNIPMNYWEISRSYYAEVTCDDFKLIALLDLGEATLVVQDKDSRKIIDQRKKDNEERKKKSFKP
jgi:hypothetical protein